MSGYFIDPEGEFVDFEIPDATGLTRPTVLTITTEELGRIYNTARATQLGANSWGDL